MLGRRPFLRISLSAAAASSIAAWAARSPIKIAHREGNMLRQSSPSVYELAASIPGLSGVEVQTTRSNLWDRETVLAYKKEANRWKMRTVSMGGSLPASGTLLQPGSAEESLRKTIHCCGDTGLCGREHPIECREAELTAGRREIRLLHLKSR